VIWWILLQTYIPTLQQTLAARSRQQAVCSSFSPSYPPIPRQSATIKHIVLANPVIVFLLHLKPTLIVSRVLPLVTPF
jgi:hypothetical protein